MGRTQKKHCELYIFAKALDTLCPRYEPESMLYGFKLICNSEKESPCKFITDYNIQDLSTLAIKLWKEKEPDGLICIYYNWQVYFRDKDLKAVYYNCQENLFEVLESGVLEVLK